MVGGTELLGYLLLMCIFNLAVDPAFFPYAAGSWIMYLHLS
jgi:hypothetical protein